MDRDIALKLLSGGNKGVLKWNVHRSRGGKIPSLDVFKLERVNLEGVNLNGTSLVRANFARANLDAANFERANLDAACFDGASLDDASLQAVNLQGASLEDASLEDASLEGASLVGANLVGANLIRANLEGANLEGTKCGYTIFVNTDLSNVRGLDKITHLGPSSIGVDSIFRSKGHIPEEFLRGCGMPDPMIAYLPSLIGSMNPIQFYSCFISHSSADKEFARRLHARMIQEGLRVWFDEIDMQAGKKLHEQIDEAIRIYDRLLLVLSPASMNSEWVKTELRRAFKMERREGKRKLFPIAMVPYSAVRDWECFDADHGKDLAVEVREYFIPDFTNWKDHDAFEAGFSRLLRDLKVEGPPASV